MHRLLNVLFDSMRFKFCKSVFLLATVMALLLAYPLYAWASAEVARAIIAAGIIAFANIIIGCITLDYSIDKSNSVFMIAVFGGMGVRMGLILVAMALLLINGYHGLALSLALMGFYVVFMIAEIMYATRDLSKRNPKVRPVRQGVDRRTSPRSLSVEHRSN